MTDTATPQIQYRPLLGDKQPDEWIGLHRKSYFYRYGRQDVILAVLRAMLLHKDAQQCDFLAAVRQRPGVMWLEKQESFCGGHIVEGPSVFGIARNESDIGDSVISFSQTIGGIQVLWGSMFLRDIEHVESLYPIRVPVLPSNNEGSNK